LSFGSSGGSLAGVSTSPYAAQASSIRFTGCGTLRFLPFSIFSVLGAAVSVLIQTCDGSADAAAGLGASVTGLVGDCLMPALALTMADGMKP
jgi:hypothetical protein